MIRGYENNRKKVGIKMPKPLIGVTCNFMRDLPDAVSEGIAAPFQSWELIAQDYVDAVAEGGGIPVLLPVHGMDKGVLNRIDGLIASGGNDVSPMLYAQRPSEKCGKLDAERDRFEIDIIKGALKLKLPLLGICRGIQILNVALGGTNCQDLQSANRLKHSIWTGDRRNGTHKVNIIEGTPLYNVLKVKEAWVNSFHHQAVSVLASPLKVCAVSSDDKVIEGVYIPGEDVMAVQWHPEMMYDNALQAKIFSYFVDRCAKRKNVSEVL